MNSDGFDIKMKISSKLKQFLTIFLGKCGTHVSCLISRLVEEALDLIMKHRDKFVRKGNRYLFHNSVGGFIRPWKHINQCAIEFKLECPELIKSTNLRKHFATAIQMANLNENQMRQIGKSNF